MAFNWDYTYLEVGVTVIISKILVRNGNNKVYYV